MAPIARIARIANTVAIAACSAVLAIARDSHAVDLPKVGGSDVSLDVTETAIVSQRFNAREGEKDTDQGYFAFLNRLNLVLGWKKLTVGMRLDSSFYELRPEDREFDDAQLARNARVDGATRYRDRIVYPAKIFVTLKDTGIEVTAGDAYVQFGRGLILSMRKVDELGIDTTLLGAKVVASKDIFGATLVAGIANPARVDEPTGRALFLPKALPGDRLGPQPLFGNDRIVGASITAGKGLAVVASTNLVILSRCAPYAYNADGTIKDGILDNPIGSCDGADRSTFIASLPPVIQTKQTINASQTLEVPSLWGHGNLYLEGAIQRRDPEKPEEVNLEGNALYGSFVTSSGPVTNTVEMKSYRNFYPLGGSVNATRASAFGNIAYSAPPTAEPVITDTMFFDFNRCVTGGRDRLDVRLSNTILVYGTFGYFRSQTEQPTGQCDKYGRSVGANAEENTDYVTDASLGTEWRFDKDKSIAFVNFTGRYDEKGNGDPYYREVSTQFSITKFITGPYSVEIAGRHRYRIQERENIRGDTFDGEPWRQGEQQIALKVAPRWIFSAAYEYTTQLGLPTDYFNGGVLWKFTPQSNIRLYGGQNRGGLRCVSGICRVFPAFSGVRAELTLRF